MVYLERDQLQWEAKIIGEKDLDILAPTWLQKWDDYRDQGVWVACSYPLIFKRKGKLKSPAARMGV